MKYCTHRFIPFLQAFAVAIVLAGCSTQPTMNTDYVKALHSGQLVIQIPKQTNFVVVLPRSPNGEEIAGAIPGAVVVGALTGAPGFALAMGEQLSAPGPMQQLVGVAQRTLNPYAEQIRSFVPLSQSFLAAGRKAVISVPWIRNSSAVVLYQGKGSLGSGKMSRLTQAAGTQAIAFAKAAIAFSPDLERVYAIVQIEVYAKDQDRASFLSGGTLYAGTAMVDVGPALKKVGVEGIAASNLDDDAALGARANLWFENSGARFKRAVSMDMEKLQKALANYLDGRRDAK